MQSDIVVAFGSVPKDGGTFTFYRNMRPALLKHGIDLRCVSVGKDQARLWEETYADEGCVQLASYTRNIKKQAMEFADWCESESVNIVMGINSEAILSSLPHLPEKIRGMSRCANAFDHGYRITLSCAERLVRIVAITPRLEHDLVHQYGADKNKICLIPNGIDPAPFEQAASVARGAGELLQLGFLGRLEHNQKGVFYIPEIVRELKRLNVPFKLRIAGKGKHRSVIEKEMYAEIESGQVEFIGAITHQQVPDFLSQTDVFIFTSHFEGCPNALLEAMMAGCVPVSWLIDHITDFIIADGRTGVICHMGDCKMFARNVAELASNRNMLQEMSHAAAEMARSRFSDRQAAFAYAETFRQIMAEPPLAWAPVPWDQFQSDPNFEHSWKEFIPERVRIMLKNYLLKGAM